MSKFQKIFILVSFVLTGGLVLSLTNLSKAQTQCSTATNYDVTGDSKVTQVDLDVCNACWNKPATDCLKCNFKEEGECLIDIVDIQTLANNVSLPDLTIKSITFTPEKSTYFKTDSVKIKTIIKNIGDAEAGILELNYSDKYKDKVKTLYSYSLPSVTLDPGEEYVDEISFGQWPETGTNTLEVTVDYTKKITEKDETNNMATRSFFYDGPIPLTVNLPAGVKEFIQGQSYNITWEADTDVFNQIFNLSLYKGGVFYDWIGGAVLSDSKIFEWTVSPTFPIGSDYFIRFQDPRYVDYVDTQKFSIITYLLPDLTPTLLEVKNTSRPSGEKWQAGDNIETTIAIQNIGKATAGIFNYTIDFGGSLQIESRTPNALDPQMTYKKTSSVAWNGKVSSKEMKVVLWADHTYATGTPALIEESNENNNTLTINVNTEGGDITPPTVLKAWTDKEVYYPGDSIIAYAAVDDDISGVQLITVRYESSPGRIIESTIYGLGVYQAPNIYKLTLVDAIDLRYQEANTYTLHYIKLQDKVGNLVEYSNPNLPVSDSFQIDASPPIADLKVNGVDSPKAMPYDTIFTLTWEVKNIKNCTAAGQPIKFVGGGDWTHRPNNIDINISGNAQMYARDAYTPNRNPLWIGLSCVSDAGQWVHENIYITISEGTPQTLPDLTIENVKTIPANPPVAQSFQIVFDLVNKGTVSADIYHNLSRQFLIQLEPPQEGVILTVMDLFEECNGDWIVDVEERCNITIGADINKAGAFKSSVMVDPDNKISELDEVNNRSSFMIDTIKKQDLIVKSIRFEDINEQNFIVAELCNIGESKLEVSGGLMTYFENLDTKMSSYTQDGLTLNSGMCTDSANEKKIFAEKLASQSGLYKIQVITDKSDIVSETRGDNNTLIQDIDIKVSALQCTDSDGGQNYYQKGETYDKGADQPFVDVCQDNILTEHWCGEDGRLQGGPYTCPNGCQDGACIVGETPLISIISPTAGPVGTEVSIFGQNFKENCQSKGSKVCQMSVNFNGKEIFWTTDFTNAVSWSHEKIVVRVPPGATTGPIKVYRNEIFNWGETNAYNEQYNLTGPVFTVEDPSITEIKTKAKLLHTDKYDELLAEIKELRNLVKEQDTKIRYLTKLITGTHNLTAQIEDRLNNFIAYGVDENTKKLGAGERAAVLYSYKSAFNKLPQKDTELEDAIKIANGRWPSEKNANAEVNAKKAFKKIYLRDANMNTPADNAAVTVISYGLRQKAENRNLNSEKQGLNIFKAIYGKMPSSTEEWNILQAITYSGAKR